jgi:hypothetical protein
MNPLVPPRRRSAEHRPNNQWVPAITSLLRYGAAVLRRNSNYSVYIPEENRRYWVNRGSVAGRPRKFSLRPLPADFKRAAPFRVW